MILTEFNEKKYKKAMRQEVIAIYRPIYVEKIMVYVDTPFVRDLISVPGLSIMFLRLLKVNIICLSL